MRLGDLDMVLRRPPFGSKVKSAHDMGREYRVLSKLHKVFAPAPQPVLYCEDDAVLGAPFYLMKRIRGVIIRRDPPAGLDFSPPVARRLGESFVDTLAALHALDYEAIGLGDLGKPHGYMQRQVEGWIKRYYGSQTHDISEVEPISRWMTERIPAQSAAALIHNDYKYDNVIVAADDITRIIGVLDWEMCTLGDPLSDLGTAICYWINADDPPEMQLIRWAPTNVPGTMTRAGTRSPLCREDGLRYIGDGFLLRVCTLQDGGDRAADLLSLSSRVDEGRALRGLSRGGEDHDAGQPAGRGNRQILKFSRLRLMSTLAF